MEKVYNLENIPAKHLIQELSRRQLLVTLTIAGPAPGIDPVAAATELVSALRGYITQTPARAFSITVLHGKP